MAKKVLIVDDEEDVRTYLNSLLSNNGYETEMAEDGEDAFRKVKEFYPDLIILDIIMPGMNGFQVLDRIRQRSNVPVIMLTAMCEVTTLHDAIVLGADDYVRKPFRMRELTARVRAKLRRADQEARRLKGA